MSDEPKTDNTQDEQVITRAEFDLSRVPLRWQRQLMKNLRRQAEIELAIAEADVTTQTALSAEVIDLTEDLEKLLAVVLVAVPRAYLHESAPDEIDWGDSDSFGWLNSQADFSQIIFDLQYARRMNPKN